ncbi:MAG: DUF302 domain-containing protein [Myxococcales bacterium]|nr:DUF302 domain-containing protein [Myxococcales bacterium]
MSNQLDVQLEGVDFQVAIELTKRALSTEGFGVLTEIDVKETLRKKLDVDFPPYTILGACNPKLAHAALQAEPQIGLFLPCNVVVKQVDTGISVQIVDPTMMMSAVKSPALEDIAKEANNKLVRVASSLKSSSALVAGR